MNIINKRIKHKGVFYGKYMNHSNVSRKCHYRKKYGQMVQLTGAYFDKEAVLTGVVGEQMAYWKWKLIHDCGLVGPE